jgi:FixJ family two-component response regulator
MPVASSLVAIVDDEESVRRALGRLLRSAGFDVQTFASGVEFIHSLARSSPQCLVLDLRMPHMTGFDVQAALLEAKAVVPVVIITGDDSLESRELTLGRGARAYLRSQEVGAFQLDAIQYGIGEQPAGGC